MNQNSPLSLLSLLITWFGVAAFALATIAYYLVSANTRRGERGLANPGQVPDPLLKRHRQATYSIELAGAAFGVLVLGLLTINVIEFYHESLEHIDASAGIARNYINEQYTVMRVTPNLIFSAFDDFTVAGLSPTIGSSIIVRAKLTDTRMRWKACNTRELRDIANEATVRLDAPELDLSPAPAVDDTHDCYVSWFWVAAPRHGGVAAALAEVTLKPKGGKLLHVTKTIHLTVTREGTGAVASSIATILVALLSLAGVVFTTLMNRAKP